MAEAWKHLIVGGVGAGNAEMCAQLVFYCGAHLVA
jgi:hypothetical protein